MVLSSETTNDADRGGQGNSSNLLSQNTSISSPNGVGNGAAALEATASSHPIMLSFLFGQYGNLFKLSVWWVSLSPLIFALTGGNTSAVGVSRIIFNVAICLLSPLGAILVERINPKRLLTTAAAVRFVLWVIVCPALGLLSYFYSTSSSSSNNTEASRDAETTKMMGPHIISIHCYAVVGVMMVFDGLAVAASTILDVDTCGVDMVASWLNIDVTEEDRNYFNSRAEGFFSLCFIVLAPAIAWTGLLYRDVVARTPTAQSNDLQPNSDNPAATTATVDNGTQALVLSMIFASTFLIGTIVQFFFFHRIPSAASFHGDGHHGGAVTDGSTNRSSANAAPHHYEEYAVIVPLQQIEDGIPLTMVQRVSGDVARRRVVVTDETERGGGGGGVRGGSSTELTIRTANSPITTQQSQREHSNPTSPISTVINKNTINQSRPAAIRRAASSPTVASPLAAGSPTTRRGFANAEPLPPPWSKVVSSTAKDIWEAILILKAHPPLFFRILFLGLEIAVEDCVIAVVIAHCSLRLHWMGNDDSIDGNIWAAMLVSCGKIGALVASTIMMKFYKPPDTANGFRLMFFFVGISSLCTIGFPIAVQLREHRVGSVSNTLLDPIISDNGARAIFFISCFFFFLFSTLPKISFMMMLQTMVSEIENGHRVYGFIAIVAMACDAAVVMSLSAVLERFTVSSQSSSSGLRDGLYICFGIFMVHGLLEMILGPWLVLRGVRMSGDPPLPSAPAESENQSNSRQRMLSPNTDLDEAGDIDRSRHDYGYDQERLSSSTTAIRSAIDTGPTRQSTSAPPRGTLLEDE